MNCELCKILHSETERIVYSDEHVFIAVNIEPLKPGHLMVLPVRHAENLSDLTVQESQAFLRSMDRAVAALGKTYAEPPVCFLNGPAQRSQAHVHIHVLPSRSNIRGTYAAAEGCPLRERLSPEALAQMAEKIRPQFS